MEDFVLPFLLCCKTNNPKLINPALSYLQRLTLHTKIQEVSLATLEGITANTNKTGDYTARYN